ncbi:uncharacterized protein [Littorina saxatilis]|uniref:uncharacterized protein n=1 Tax=Littorina saxatilis TaxID=31220 RepID=UPI0038B4FD68
MTEILGDIEGVICYYDDIMLHTSTNEEHDKLLKRVFQRLKEVGLELNEDKCEYKKTELKFLGHVISENGVRPDESKVEAIVKMKEPENVEELRRYLGMVNYLRRVRCATSFHCATAAEQPVGQGNSMVVGTRTSFSVHQSQGATDFSANTSVLRSDETNSLSDTKLKQIREETAKDVNLKTAFDYTVAGWPEYKQDVMLAARDFFTIRGELSVCDGL